MSAKKLRIIQATDLHISPSDAPVNRYDSRKNWLAALTAIQNLEPDLLVLSGDLASLKGEIESYQWLANTLTDIDIPYEIMMGNHDKLNTLKSIFSISEQDVIGRKLCYQRQYQGQPIYFVDTADHTLSDAQIEWLQQCDQAENKNALLFIHHPPIDCGTAFMDKNHALKEREKVWAVLSQLKHIQHIFCGHYHTERSIYLDNKNVHITPSTMNQIQTELNGFGAEHSVAGWRVIDWDGAQLITHVHYLWD
jgi:Icc protein